MRANPADTSPLDVAASTAPYVSVQGFKLGPAADRADQHVALDGFQFHRPGAARDHHIAGAGGRIDGAVNAPESNRAGLAPRPHVAAQRIHRDVAVPGLQIQMAMLRYCDGKDHLGPHGNLPGKAHVAVAGIARRKPHFIAHGGGRQSEGIQHRAGLPRFRFGQLERHCHAHFVSATGHDVDLSAVGVEPHRATRLHGQGLLFYPLGRLRPAQHEGHGQ
jgi:hypothetical protein